jgi:hypothetical protein
MEEVTLLTLHLADNLAEWFRVPLRKPWEEALVRHFPSGKLKLGFKNTSREGLDDGCGDGMALR